MSPDRQQRWYIIPDVVDWNMVLDWLVQHALTAYAPGVLRRRYLLARLSAAVAVATVLWAWALAQYPVMLLPDTTVDQTAAHPAVLRILLIVTAIGACCSFPPCSGCSRSSSAPADPPASSMCRAGGVVCDVGEVVDCREVGADLRGFGDAELVVEGVGSQPVRPRLVRVGEEVVGMADTRVGACQLGSITDGLRMIVRLPVGAKSLDRISGRARGFA